MIITARFIDRIDEIDAAQWDALRPDDNPFVSHAFLAGLEQHGCLTARNGWVPHHLTLHNGGDLIGAAPVYLKGNSHGEFVFDHAWADAYWRNGIDYYPKLLCAVPYSPVAGPRLLVGKLPSTQLRDAGLAALRAEVQRLGLSSAHINFNEASTPSNDWLARSDWQFHWTNRSWNNFDAFLQCLSAKKRKNIRQERAHVKRAGVRFRWLHGDEATDADLATMHRFYLETFSEKGNLAALSLDFFHHLARSLPRQTLVVLADREGAAVAGALLLRSSTTLYGRYWGAIDPLPGLHFETCYYQGIEYCLANGLDRFEPGAQGEHKLARGFLPTATHSQHYVDDPRFRAAIEDALRRETVGQQRHFAELMQHSPYRHD